MMCLQETGLSPCRPFVLSAFVNCLSFVVDRAMQFLQQLISEAGSIPLACAYSYSQAVAAHWVQLQMTVAMGFAQQQQQEMAAAATFIMEEPLEQPRQVVLPAISPNTDVAVGVPIVGMLHSMASPWAGQCFGNSSAVAEQPQQTPSDAPFEGLRVAGQSHTAVSSSPSPRWQRWQSAGDAQLRLESARAIMRLLRERGMQSLLGKKMLPAVRLVEVMLYRTAKTKAAYLDSSTLEARVVAFVRHRAAVAAAGRCSSAPASGSSSPRAGCAIPHPFTASVI
jgi:hypothetical protein